MTCLPAHAIAQAASSEVLDPHLGTCLVCRRKVDADRSLRARLAMLPVPALAPARQRELAAEIAALAERLPPQRSRRWIWIGTAVAAAATVAMALAWPRAIGSSVPEVAAIAVSERAEIASRWIAHEVAPARLPSPTIAAGDGSQVSQLAGDDHDRVTLSDGTVEIDSRGARDVDVRIGKVIVHVADARVEIRARDRSVVSVHVIVGAAQITSSDQRVTVEHGSLWQAEPAAAPHSLRAFRDAWVALRSGDNRRAMELFDAATEPAVAEEASFWAAIAAKRAGEASLARDRLTEFLRRYPRSPYAARASAALAAP